MIYTLLDKLILDRLKADTGTGGLYQGSTWHIITGAYGMFATPQTATRPYLVYNVAATDTSGLTDDAYDVSVTFDIYDDQTNGNNSISAVIDRLHGNAVLQTQRIPTYGFHRWRGTIDTNSYSAGMDGQALVKAFSVQALEERTVLGTVRVDFKYSALASSP